MNGSKNACFHTAALIEDRVLRTPADCMPGLAAGKKLETLYDDGRAGALRRLVRLWFLMLF